MAHAGKDHFTADQCCVWLFVVRQSSVTARLSYQIKNQVIYFRRYSQQNKNRQTERERIQKW